MMERYPDLHRHNQISLEFANKTVRAHDSATNKGGNVGGGAKGSKKAKGKKATRLAGNGAHLSRSVIALCDTLSGNEINRHNVNTDTTLTQKCRQVGKSLRLNKNPSEIKQGRPKKFTLT